MKNANPGNPSRNCRPQTREHLREPRSPNTKQPVTLVVRLEKASWSWYQWHLIQIWLHRPVYPQCQPEFLAGYGAEREWSTSLYCFACLTCLKDKRYMSICPNQTQFQHIRASNFEQAGNWALNNLPLCIVGHTVRRSATRMKAYISLPHDQAIQACSHILKSIMKANDSVSLFVAKFKQAFLYQVRAKLATHCTKVII